MQKILVTGVNGFVGKHLTRELKNRGCDVVGLDHSGPANEQVAELLSNYFTCNLTDRDAVAKLPLEDIDGIINLAGLAQVGDSFKNPDLYMKVNVGVLENLGRVLISKKSSARMIAISTGAVYDSNQAMPLTEESKLVANSSPYAQSKIAMEKAAAKLKQDGLDCAVVRPFNHIGPGQAPGFLVPDLFAKIKQSLQTGDPVLVGKLNTKRDYTDVRDVVGAYTSLIMAEKLNYTIYNVCSGISITGQVVLETILSATGLTGKITVQQDQSLIRPNDPEELFGSHQKLSQDTNWLPKIKLDQTIKDIVATS